MAVSREEKGYPTILSVICLYINVRVHSTEAQAVRRRTADRIMCLILSRRLDGYSSAAEYLRAKGQTQLRPTMLALCYGALYKTTSLGITVDPNMHFLRRSRRDSCGHTYISKTCTELPLTDCSFKDHCLVSQYRHAVTYLSLLYFKLHKKVWPWQWTETW